ncbi:GAF domain-containing protein, partial [Klebsiella pneumoniae]|nr:GAF domain-containing protein [Klebsiella pneumoniae]
MAAAGELAAMLDRLMEDLQSLFGIRHAMVLMLEEAGRRLYTVASRGYASSGVGSEIAVGQGVIGVAARERTPIRITRMTG